MRSGDEGGALVLCAGGGIGDSLFAAVAGRALHRRYARVDALTLPSHRAALERVPDFDDILTDDGGDERSLADAVRHHGYAASVTTWATPRAARIAWRARIPIRVGQARRLYSGLFTKRVVVRSECGDVTSHWSQILLDYARALSCDTEDAFPRFVPTEEDEREARVVMERCRLTARDFVIMHPFNAIASRVAWPVAGWAALSRALAGHFNVKVAVTGGKTDRSIAEAIVGPSASLAGVRYAPDDNVVSLAGETSIGAFGALARHARAFVGITTGAMHVAAAVGCPTVGIFPFQADFPERWAPLGKRTAIVRASYACRAGDTKERCRANYSCIEHLDVARILGAAEAMVR